MYTAEQVGGMISNWKKIGMTKEEIVIQAAEACMGWSYVWGGSGQLCTKANRESYANRSTCPDGEKTQIRKLCKRINSGASSCDGCKWYPGGTTRFFDCRGFTRWILQQVCDWTLQGAGATSQWNTASNWSQKGSIKDMPNVVCLVFMQKGSTMEHTGIHVGDGRIIHCSGTVKEGKITDKGWTHYGIPVCLDGQAPSPMPDIKPTIRKGSTGSYVTLAQTMLIQRGYDLGSYGADGKFGAKTETAVKQFQRDCGLGVDGIIGPKTWAALETYEPETYTVRIEHLSKAVAAEITDRYGGTMTKE